MHIQVKAFIEANLSQLASPAEIADRFCISYETLRKNFRRAEGVTIAAYITQRRVLKAAELLATTDLRCYEVGYEVGFTREDVAARVFKRHMRVTMQEFRHQPA